MGRWMDDSALSVAGNRRNTEMELIVPFLVSQPPARRKLHAPANCDVVKQFHYETRFVIKRGKNHCSNRHHVTDPLLYFNSIDMVRLG